jgi:hypothetical protein
VGISNDLLFEKLREKSYRPKGKNLPELKKGKLQAKLI